MTGPVGFFEVSDIAQSLQALLDVGTQIQQEARDVGGGKLVAYVKDADGNSIGLIQSPQLRRFSPGRRGSLSRPFRVGRPVSLRCLAARSSSRQRQEPRSEQQWSRRSSWAT